MKNEGAIITSYKLLYQITMHPNSTWLKKAEEHLAIIKQESPSSYVRHKTQVVEWHRSLQDMQLNFEKLIQEIDHLHSLVQNTLHLEKSTSLKVT